METRAIEPDSARLPRLPVTVVRLGWVSFLTDVSSEMIVSLLPAFLGTLPGASPAMALGWIEGIAETTASGAKIVSGRLADRRRAKKGLVLLGYSLSSLARPLIGLAHGWLFVLSCRFADRIGKGIRSAPRDALIASVSPKERWGEAFGLHRAFDNAGAVLGPLVAAGLIWAFGMPVRTVFFAAAIPGLVSLWVLAYAVREDVAPPPATTGGEAAGPLEPLPRSFGVFAALTTLFTLSASSDTFLLLKAREVGVPVYALPVMWSFGNSIRAGFSRWGGGLSDRFGRRPLLLSAWGLYAVCYAAFAVARSAMALVAILGVYSMYAALSEGAERAMVADLVPAASRGRAFGWLFGLTGLAALPASVGFGWMWEHLGSRPAFLVGAGIAALAVLLMGLFGPRPPARA